MNFKIIFNVLIILAVVFSFNFVILFSQVSEDEVKVAFIEKLTRFIDWPEKCSIDKSHSFVIGVYGSSTIIPFLYELQKVKTIKEKKIEIKQINNLSEVENCHILFLSKSEKRRVSEVARIASEKSILTISDSEGMAEKGIMINFYTENANLKFEINLEEANKAGFKISSKLLKLAKII